MSNVLQTIIDNHNPSINVTLNINDLVELGEYLITETIKKVSESEEKYLSTSEVLNMLGVTRSTLWRWEKNNYLTPRRIGNKPKYLMSDIRKLLEKPKI